MFKLINKITGAALFAVAVLPIVALSAARAEPATIRISDLNLSQPAAVETFNARVDHAAYQVCSGVVDLTQAAACKASVRQEAMDKLSQAEAAQVATLTVASR